MKISMAVLPGEKTDGSGRVCIHLFVPDPAGVFVETHALQPEVKDGMLTKRVEVRPTRGRLACDAKRNVRPFIKDGFTVVTPRTDDPRAVSCPRCKASPEYAERMKLLGE